MKSAQINVKQRALKAIFKLRSSLQGCNVSPHLSLKLFDQMIKPIALYGSEIWANMPFTKKSYNQETILKYMDKLAVENLHTRFCKYILGVHSKATNSAVMGELGRYPLGVDILVHMLKFYDHLKAHTNVLVSSALQESVNLHEGGSRSWVSFIKGVVEDGTFPQRNLNPHSNARILKNKLVSTVQCNWRAAVMNNESKLLFYKSFKSNFTYEKYLSLVKSRKERTALTKIRISAHRLPIERGRYAKPKPIPREERWCTYCKKSNNLVIGDEYHIFSTCPKFDKERKHLFDQVSVICPAFSDLDDRQKIIFLMTAEGDIPALVARFAYVSSLD